MKQWQEGKRHGIGVIEVQADDRCDDRHQKHAEHKDGGDCVSSFVSAQDDVINAQQNEDQKARRKKSGQIKVYAVHRTESHHGSDDDRGKSNQRQKGEKVLKYRFLL